MSNRPTIRDLNMAVAWARLNQSRLALIEGQRLMEEASGAFLRIDPDCGPFHSLGEIIQGALPDVIESITELCDEPDMQLSLNRLHSPESDSSEELQ